MAYTKTVWEDLPSTNTPITAENLNNMEDGIETNDKKLSGEEAMGNLVVDSIRSKNMLDSSTIVQGDIANGYPDIQMTSRQVLWLEPGTYTFSTNLGSSYQFGIQVQNVGTLPLSTWPSTFIYSTNWLATGTTTHTFTTTTSGWFNIMLRRSDNGSFTSTDITNLKGYNYQLETGEDATTYSTYFTPANEMSDKLNQITFKSTSTEFKINQYSGINLNNLADKLGITFIYGTSLTNAPVGALGYIITICILDPAYAKQYFMAPWSGSPEIYTRTKDNGTWSSWYKINAVAL